MLIKNATKFQMDSALRESVILYPVDGLTVELKYCPEGSGRYASGTYYRKTTNFENGKLIRIRINKYNRYPVEVHFKTSEYERKRNIKGQEQIYQKLRMVKLHTPEDLVLAIFLHEFSHYLDHIECLNGRYKQTKADKFAVDILERLEVIPIG